MIRYSKVPNRKQYRIMRKHRNRHLRRNPNVSIKDLLYLVIAGVILVSALNSLSGLVIKVADNLSKIQPAVAKEAPEIIEKYVEVPAKPFKDDREVKLEKFLKSKNSPLAPYAYAIVQNADMFGIGWTDIVSISSIESSYCTRTIPNSHNCWGLGGENNFMHFKSYTEAIYYVSELIGNDYAMNKNMAIQTKYCPTTECYKNWPQTVTASSKEILGVNK